MAKETVVETTGQKVETKEGQQQQDATPRTYSAEEFKAIVAQRDELKQTMRTAKEKAEKETKEREDAQLVAKNDFETLKTRHEAERAEEKRQLQATVSATYVTALGVKYGVLRDEYLKIFTPTLELDGYEIKNSAAVETAFGEFKKSNPTLFKDGKGVPSVDNLTPKRIDSTLPENSVTGYDLIRQHYLDNGVNLTSGKLKK